MIVNYQVLCQQPVILLECAGFSRVLENHPEIRCRVSAICRHFLRRFCEARRSDIASIITRSQFLLVLTSSLYAAYFIARPSPMAFSLLEATAALVMLPSIVMLLQSGRPLGYFDEILDIEYMLSKPNKIPETMLILLGEQAKRLLVLNKLCGTKLRRSYYVWLASLLVAALLLVWSHY